MRPREGATSSQIHHQLRRILAGDEGAAAWLYDTFAPELYRRLKRRYGHLGDTDPADLLHDAFLLFFQHDGRVLRRFLERTPETANAQTLAAYLWDQACGVASNRRRSAWHLRAVPVGEVRATAGAGDAAERTVARDTLERLLACLGKARGRVFLYFRLRYCDALTPEEIVQATGWSRKATYKLRQAMNRVLDRCLETLGLTR